MNEKIQTQTVTGSRPVQRDAGSQGRVEINKEIASLEAEEALLFNARGYGGYIDSDQLATIRSRREALKPQGGAQSAQS